MPTVIVRLLGPVEVDVDGVPVAIGGERQRALLAALALSPHRTVAVNELVVALWGDDAAEHEHRLQQQVSSLRKLLEPDRARNVEPTILVTAPPGYQLRCDEVDARSVELAMTDAATAAAAHRWADALEAYDRALVPWRGAPVADVRVSDWFDAIATRLEDRRLTAQEGRVDALLALGRPADAIGELDGLVRDAPFRERFRAQLMLAYYRCERQTDALAVFNQTRTLLVEELGIDPGPELRALEQAILRHDPALRAEAAGGPTTGAHDELAETFRPDQIDCGYIVRPDGQIITLTEPTSIIGRDPTAQVQLVDSRVSRRHAQIDRDGDTYSIGDLGSTNGTTVNGAPADGQALRDGDTIGIGSIALTFHQGRPTG